MGRKTSFTVTVPAEDVVGVLEDARRMVLIAEEAVSVANVTAMHAADLAKLDDDAARVLASAEEGAMEALKALRGALAEVACMVRGRAESMD